MTDKQMEEKKKFLFEELLRIAEFYLQGRLTQERRATARKNISRLVEELVEEVRKDAYLECIRDQQWPGHN